MPPAEIQANRDAAAVAVKAQLGLPASHLSWTYDQGETYKKALAAYIASRPDQFTDQELLTADLVAKDMYSALEDDSFQWGEFATETAKPASDALQSVGSGVLTVANSAKWAIPLLAVGASLLLLLSLNKKLGSPVPLGK